MVKPTPNQRLLQLHTQFDQNGANKKTATDLGALRQRQESRILAVRGKEKRRRFLVCRQTKS